ncbi:MAG: hotdog fold domain-containing protein [Nocardioides sp.]
MQVAEPLVDAVEDQQGLPLGRLRPLCCPDSHALQPITDSVRIGNGQVARAAKLPTGNIALCPRSDPLAAARPAPQGPRLFSFAFARKAPYFASIRPRFTVVEANHAELVIPNRRRVHNHLGTVHAIALCNGLEAVMGALAEVTIPRGKRWIPKGMEVSYTAKADSDITCIAETDPAQWASDEPDLPVRVRGCVRTAPSWSRA